MKRSRPQLDLGTRYLSPGIAAFCGLAAVCMVLVAVVVAPRLSPSVEPVGLTPVEASMNDAPYDVVITLEGEARLIHGEADGSDATPYSPDDIGLRLRQAKNRGAPITRALLVVGDKTSVQELQATLEELKALGIVSIAVSSNVPDAGP
jgi:hypothetical protein